EDAATTRANHARKSVVRHTRVPPCLRAMRAECLKQGVFLQCMFVREVRDASASAHDAPGCARRGGLAAAVPRRPGLDFFSPGLLTAEKTVISFRPADATCRLA